MKFGSVNLKEIISDSKDIIYYRSLTGGIIGAGVGFILSPRVLTLPKMKLVNSISPIYTTIGGALVGSIAGLLIGGLNIAGRPYNSIQQNIKEDYEETNKNQIKLRSEVLDLYKKRVQTGEVEIHKEVVEENKNISIPVMREDIVIEKRESARDISDLKNKVRKTIRIPIREERFKVVKYPVALENVSVYKNEVNGQKHIEETLKTEKINIKTKGNANVKIIEKQDDNFRKKQGK